MKLIKFNIFKLTIFFILFCSFNAFAKEYKVTFRTGPEDTAIFVVAPHNRMQKLKLTASNNGGRTAILEAGKHEIMFSCNVFFTAKQIINVNKNGIIIEQKLERTQSRLKLVRIVDTDLRPKSVEYTKDGKYLIVAPLSGECIDIFDSQTGELIKKVAPESKYAIQTGFVESASFPERNELWISQMYTSKIHIFSLSDFSFLRTVNCGGNFPKVILAHPDGHVFVSNWLSETVSVLSADGSERIAKMAINGIPRGMGISKDGNILYVANFASGTIEVWDARKFTKIKTLFTGADGMPKGGAKRHIVIDNNKNRLYASDMGRGSVFAYDIENDKFLKEIVINKDAKTNTIACSPNGEFLYVSTRGKNNAIDYELKGPNFGELLVIDTDSLEIVERHFGGNQPTGLAVSPDGKTIVFTDFLDHKLEFYSAKY